jgi:hypothetical protein
MKIFRTLLNLFVFLIFCSPAFSQNDSSYAKAVAVYKSNAGTSMHLYNGSEYIDYDHRIKGNPYFAGYGYYTGSIIYDGILYDSIEMMYDILNDNIIIKNYNDTALLLVQEKISAFNTGGHNFIRLQTDTALKEFKINGFYDVLYNGNTKLFARYKKFVTEKITTQYSESSYTEKDEYFILKNETFYAVNDKKSVLNVLKDHKAELQKYIRQQKIRFRKNPAGAMAKTIAYYDSLTK